MGLDMYAYATDRNLADAVDFPSLDGDTEIHYWRKHPDLHGWMEQLYHSKGGTKTFNCTTVQLTAEDIDQLEPAIRGLELPDTCGFFFGDSDGTEIEDDLAFIEAARAAIAKGLNVYYSSWW